MKLPYENKYSVRSYHGCMHDAKNIALLFGGGGHEHAAGFSFEGDLEGGTK